MVLPDGDPQIYNFIWKRTLQLEKKFRYGVKIGFQEELDLKRTEIGENVIFHWEEILWNSIFWRRILVKIGEERIWWNG